MMAVQSEWSREATRQLFRRYGSVVILATESLSDAFQVDMANNVVVQIPATWDAAAITFQVSLDGTAWAELYNAAGVITFASDAAGRAYHLEGGFRFIKVRSGTAAAAVAQAADRTILVGAYD